VYEDTAEPEAPPPPVAEIVAEITKPVVATGKKPPAAKPAEAKVDKDDEEVSTRSPLSPEMKALRSSEDRTLKDIIESFGDSTAYKCKISRKYPLTMRDRTGKIVQTGGFLEWVEGVPIDESWIQERYAGGKYELLFRKRGPKGGWEFGGQVTIEIAGDPDLRLPGGTAAEQTTTGPASSSEPPTMAKAALDLMHAELNRAHDRADKGSGGGGGEIVDVLREQLRESRLELAAFRAEMRDQANRTPPQTSEDKVKDRWLEKLMDGDTARVTAVRSQFESEIRMLKEQAIENERRLYDRFERDRQDMRNSHEREIALLRSSHDTSVSSARGSMDTQLAATKASFDTQREIMAAENRRLERDNTELRQEVKDLRAKKDKSFPEMAKELESVKEVLGIGDGDDKGIGDKFGDMLTNPEAIAAIGKIIRGEQPPPPPQQPAPGALQPGTRRVVRHKDGKKYIYEADGSLTGPLPAKPPGKAGAPPPPPEIDPAVISQMVTLLENAYSNGADPEIVARTAKPHVTDEMLTIIRDVGGVDAFLSKVAKLPGSSPLLSSQAGRNWVRKVGKSLVGDE
jgi:hypothetical protein